jgi:hypothetical protein
LLLFLEKEVNHQTLIPEMGFNRQRSRDQIVSFCEAELRFLLLSLEKEEKHWTKELLCVFFGWSSGAGFRNSEDASPVCCEVSGVSAVWCREGTYLNTIADFWFDIVG